MRSEGWRYIRYANGDEELYDEAHDPYEWANLAGDSAYADTKQQLARYLPESEHPNVGKGDEQRTPDTNDN